MTPRRVACKFLVRGDPRAEVPLRRLHSFIGMFHEFIQKGALDGLLLDVADYAHVPDGPGVMLIGHDVDYGIDRAGGLTGLLTTRKRFGDLPLAESARAVLRSGLRAADAIERDGRSGLAFETGAVTIQLIDRLAAPNDPASYDGAVAALAPVLEHLYGEKYETVNARAEDPRAPLTISVTARDAGAAGNAADLAARLGDD